MISDMEGNDVKEYQKRSYEDLSSEFQRLYPRVPDLIQLMYNRLTLVDKLSHKEAVAKIYNDHQHLSGFSRRNIRRNLPLDNATVPRRIRPSWPKNSTTETAEASKLNDTIQGEQQDTSCDDSKETLSKQAEEKLREQQKAATQESVITDETSKDRKASIPNITGTDDNSEVEVPATNPPAVHEPTPFAETGNINGTSLIAIDKLARDRTGLEECPNCSDLRLRNQGLEEALRQATTLSTADTLHSKANIIPNEESEIEFPLPYQHVQQYMAAEYRRGKSKVWFSVKVNVKVNKVTSAKAGRISESEANWNDIN